MYSITMVPSTEVPCICVLAFNKSSDFYQLECGQLDTEQALQTKT